MPLDPAPGGGYFVACDGCNGRHFLANGQVCPKCTGEGRIRIMPTFDGLTFSQRAAKEVAWIALAVFLTGMLIAGALHWLGMI